MRLADKELAHALQELEYDGEYDALEAGVKQAIEIIKGKKL